MTCFGLMFENTVFEFIVYISHSYVSNRTMAPTGTRLGLVFTLVLAALKDDSLIL